MFGFDTRRRRREEDRFLEHLPLIERVATRAATKGGFVGPDVEDFVSQVKVKLIDDDYAVLRKRRGSSSLPTFLVVVIQNLLRDYRNHKWGKYRPTEAARRLGSDAVRLEALLVRDALPLDTAVEMMARHHDRDRGALRALAALLPVRHGRTFVDDAVLERRGVDGGVEQRVEDDERARTAAVVDEVLRETMSDLPPDDVLVLRMHVRDGLPISQVARILRCDQRSLYTSKDRSLRALRRAFEARGLTWTRVGEILGWEGLTLDPFGLDDEGPGNSDSGAV